MVEEDPLKEMARVKAEIQRIQLWVDNAPTNRIARVRYRKVKERLKGLVREHRGLFQKWVEKEQEKH